jgi:hypothetical protein
MAVSPERARRHSDRMERTAPTSVVRYAGKAVISSGYSAWQAKLAERLYRSERPRCACPQWLQRWRRCDRWRRPPRPIAADSGFPTVQRERSAELRRQPDAPHERGVGGQECDRKRACCERALTDERSSSACLKDHDREKPGGQWDHQRGPRRAKPNRRYAVRRFPERGEQHEQQRETQQRQELDSRPTPPSWSAVRPHGTRPSACKTAAGIASNVTP